MDTNLLRAAVYIRDVLERELAMRKRVFRDRPQTLAAKTTEITVALTRLEQLVQALGLDETVPPSPQQGDLFD